MFTLGSVMFTQGSVMFAYGSAVFTQGGAVGDVILSKKCGEYSGRKSQLRDKTLARGGDIA
ncbi:hypothetical protein CYJ16_06520 [Actinotignum timonense]|nr:hypothetical protein CYJ16_06520 [Actinotignum timonense]